MIETFGEVKEALDAGKLFMTPHPESLSTNRYQQ